MGTEIEVKFRVSPEKLEELREKLRKLGGTQVFYYERNILFDDKKKNLRKRGWTLRLRYEYQQSLPVRRILTSKKDLPEESVFSEKEEVNIPLNDNLHRVIKIILGLQGLEKVFVYDKEKEDWFGFDVSVYVGRMPIIGSFLEIEGEKGKIRLMAEKLGLDMKDAIKNHYLAIWEEYRKRLKMKPYDLTFLPINPCKGGEDEENLLCRRTEYRKNDFNKRTC